jgi:putative ABC transport system permease protein
MQLFQIKTAIRILQSQRKLSILNIGGLTLGLVLTFMIVLLLYYELSFDRFHPDLNSIYEVVTNDFKSGKTNANTPMPLPNTLKNDFANVENTVGIWVTIGEDREIIYNGLAYSGFTGASVDKDIFNIFAYELILGNLDEVLDSENKVVVSEKFAKTIFGSENPVGKTITFDRHNFTISGLYKDLPNNSDVQFDILFSDKLRNQWDNEWWSSAIYTYVKLSKGYKLEDFDKDLKEIPARYFPDFLKGRETFSAVPFAGLHLNNSIEGGLNGATSPVYLSILGFIAFLTLLLACFNFINLTTSSAIKKSKINGIRKVLGAKPGQIISLQMHQSLICALVALLISIPCCYFLLPYFDYLTQRPISDQFGNPEISLIIVGIVLVVALLTGILPGIYFSKISVLKSLANQSTHTKSWLRNGFIVLQFTITTMLILAQFVILKQIGFMQNADLGFDNYNLLVIGVSMIDAENDKQKYERAELFTSEVEKFGAQFGFSKGTITENIPGFYYQNSFTVLPVDGNIDECLVTSTSVGDNFLDVYGIKMIEGRFFSNLIKSDENAFIINETLMKQIGWNNIEGKYLRYQQDEKVMPVIGVIKDIHTSTLKEPIVPMAYKYGQHNNSPAFVTFRLLNSNSDEVIAQMNNEWMKLFPFVPMQPFFVKDKYLQNYIEEKRVAKIIGNFALFAILISSIGLLGMFLFLIDQRVKEIGIRKVNGAKDFEIIQLLNADFIKWVTLAFIIACPIAYFAMNKWLQNFAYKTELSWWVFALAGCIALLIALLTVSWQTYRAARRNPVEALRYE